MILSHNLSSVLLFLEWFDSSSSLEVFLQAITKNMSSKRKIAQMVFLL